MNTKTLCRYLGGSHLYHLDTPQSDRDERGVFMVTEPSYILGTMRHDEKRRQTKAEDTRAWPTGSSWTRIIRF